MNMMLCSVLRIQKLVFGNLSDGLATDYLIGLMDDSMPNSCCGFTINMDTFYLTHLFLFIFGG